MEPPKYNEERRPILPRTAQQNGADYYNFKGFMLFCFGAPGISPGWCSKYATRSSYVRLQKDIIHVIMAYSTHSIATCSSLRIYSGTSPYCGHPWDSTNCHPIKERCPPYFRGSIMVTIDSVPVKWGVLISGVSLWYEEFHFIHQYTNIG